jgi:hypothetical protein
MTAPDPAPAARQLPQAYATWRDFYADLVRDGAIPFEPIADFRDSAAVASDLELPLADAVKQAQAGGRAPSTYRFMADVLSIGEPVSMAFPHGGMLIAARRIENIGGGLSLDFRGGHGARVAIGAQSLAAPLKVAITDADGAREEILSAGDALGMVLSLDEHGRAIREPLLALPGSYDWRMPLRLSLTAILHYGTACFDDYPRIAEDMFAYVARATANVDTACGLHAQALSLRAGLRMATNPVIVVPALDRDVYAQEARDFEAAALAHEEQRRIYMASAGDAHARGKAAGLMLEKYADAARFQQTMVGQAEKDLEQARRAAADARDAADNARHAAEISRIGFETEATIWAREKKIEAALSIVESVFTVVGSIALMSAETAGPAAAKKVQGAVVQAADMAAAIRSGAADAKRAKEAVESLKRLHEVAEAINKITESVTSVLEAVKRAKDVSELADIEMPAGAIDSTDPQWDSFLIDVEALLQPAVDDHVSGSSDYLKSLRKLALFSKAALSAQAAEAKAGQELLKLSLQELLEKAQHARVGAYIEALGTNEQAAEALADIFLSRELDMRLWMYLAMRSYAGAYHYWAMAPSAARPSMITPIANAKVELAAIGTDYGKALERFDPPPQEMPLTEVIVGENDGGAEAIASLRGSRRATIPIASSDPAFHGLGRVRLNCVRIWLHGVEASRDKPILIDLTTSGHFEDRLRGENLEFSAAPVRRSFEYIRNDRDPKGIRLDGVVEERERFCFFQPTPFTQWTVEIADGPDLSGLTGLTMEFQGSAIRDRAH